MSMSALADLGAQGSDNVERSQISESLNNVGIQRRSDAVLEEKYLTLNRARSNSF
jgi:hypothetical protein